MNWLTFGREAAGFLRMKLMQKPRRSRKRNEFEHAGLMGWNDHHHASMIAHSPRALYYKWRGAVSREKIRRRRKKSKINLGCFLTDGKKTEKVKIARHFWTVEYLLQIPKLRGNISLNCAWAGGKEVGSKFSDWGRKRRIKCEKIILVTNFLRKGRKVS